MLVTGLLHAVFWIANVVVSAFPKADTSWINGAVGKVGDLASFMRGLDAHLPITELMTAVGIFAAIWIVITVVVFVRKLYSAGTGGGGI